MKSEHDEELIQALTVLNRLRREVVPEGEGREDFIDMSVPLNRGKFADFWRAMVAISGDEQLRNEAIRPAFLVDKVNEIHGDVATKKEPANRTSAVHFLNWCTKMGFVTRRPLIGQTLFGVTRKEWFLSEIILWEGWAAYGRRVEVGLGGLLK